MQQAAAEEVRRGTEVAMEAGRDGRVSLKRLTEASRRPGARQARVNRLTYEMRESIWRQEPWLRRGCIKQTGDLVKHGFTVISPDTEDAHPDDGLAQAWLRKTHALTQARRALLSAHQHGDGIVEIEWDDGGSGDQPVKAGAMPIAIHVIDPVSIEFEQDPKDGLTYLIQNVWDSKNVVLHPDRYHHFYFDRLEGYEHALATVEVVFHAAMAKIKGDQGSGEVVYNAGQPKVHAIVKEARPGDIEETIEMVNDPDFVRGYVTDDRTSMVQLNPVALDPEPYYGVWKSSEAAGIGIPVMFLEGAQAGALVGSETNLDDYHSDQHQLKVTVLQPFFARMVSALLLVDEAEFDLKWAEPPLNKSKMAAAARDQATAFGLFRSNGFTVEAASRLAGLETGEDDFEDDGQGDQIEPVDVDSAAGVPRQPGQGAPAGQQPGAADPAAPAQR